MAQMEALVCACVHVRVRVFVSVCVCVECVRALCVEACEQVCEHAYAADKEKRVSVCLCVCILV
jgi:hypothetical protein